MYSKNQMLILGLFFAHPGEELYLSQIGDSLGKHPGVFQRGINALEKTGVLVSRKRGNQRIFSVNEKYPLLEELRSIVGKTAGVERMLSDIAASLCDIHIALIYGSYASNTMRPDSDIDLLLVVTDPGIEDAVVDRLSAIERTVSREINYTMYTVQEFNNKRSAHDPFLSEILNRSNILLKGRL